MKNKHYHGFTLSETLVVLSVVLLVTVLPVIAYKDWQKNVKNEAFFQAFESYYYRAQLSAMYSASPTFIYIDKGKGITIYLKNFNKVTQTVILAIPSEITCQNTLHLQFKSLSGNVSEIGSFSFIDTTKNRKIEYRIQLGSGKLVKEIKEL